MTYNRSTEHVYISARLFLTMPFFVAAYVSSRQEPGTVLRLKHSQKP